ALKAMQASALAPLKQQVATPTPSATSYRSDLQTLDAARQRDRLAATLTVLPTGRAAWVFRSSTATPGPEDHTPLTVTPNTQGVIVDVHDQAIAKALGMTWLNAWTIDVDNKHVNVYAGAYVNDDTQGMVYVDIFTFDGIELPDGG